MKKIADAFREQQVARLVAERDVVRAYSTSFNRNSEDIVNDERGSYINHIGGSIVAMLTVLNELPFDPEVLDGDQEEITLNWRDIGAAVQKNKTHVAEIIEVILGDKSDEELQGWVERIMKKHTQEWGGVESKRDFSKAVDEVVRRRKQWQITNQLLERRGEKVDLDFLNLTGDILPLMRTLRVEPMVFGGHLRAFYRVNAPKHVYTVSSIYDGVLEGEWGWETNKERVLRYCDDEINRYSRLHSRALGEAVNIVLAAKDDESLKAALIRRYSEWEELPEIDK